MKTQPFHFIHAADLHLGCAFQGLHATAPEIAKALREATYRAFDNMLDYAIEQRVDFVVLAGDIYNRNENSLQPQLRFRDGLQRLHNASIPCCIIHGNHDPLDGTTDGLKWPESCHRFPAADSEPCIIRKNGEEIAVVAGISYWRHDVTENLSLRYKHAHKHLFSVGVLHTNCGSNGIHDPYAPSSVEELRSMDFDYWALGHIHAHAILHAANPTVVYAGSIQGLNPKEVGEHGFCHVKVDGDHKAKVQFVPVSPILWQLEHLDASLWNTEDDAVSALEARVVDISEAAGGRSVLLRLTIGGRSALHRWLNVPGHQDDLLARLRSQSRSDPFVWVDRIRVETKPSIDLHIRAQGEDIVGEVLRQAHEAIATENGQKLAATQLNDLFTHSRAGFLQPPSPEQMTILIEWASLLVADRLVEDEEEKVAL